MLRDDEREAWRGFLAAAPEFVGDAIGSAVDGPDPPDILCVTRSGKKIGVELTKWVEHGQVASGKARESFEDSYLDIIASANHARPERIGWVWLHPKSRGVKPEDVPQFREELYECPAPQIGVLAGRRELDTVRRCRGSLHSIVDGTGSGGSDLGKGGGLRRPESAHAACARRTPSRLPLLRRSTLVQRACASPGI